MPALRNHRLQCGHRKIIQTAADDFFPRQTQEPAGADTGLPVTTLVVREENGRGRVKYDRAEEGLELLRTIFREPASGMWKRGRNDFLVCPVDPAEN